MRTFLLVTVVFLEFAAHAQGVPRNAQGTPVTGGAAPTTASADTTGIRSEHGWYLTPHGTLRVLVLFAEVVYDKDPGRDPQPDGAAHWPKGRLPTEAKNARNYIGCKTGCAIIIKRP